MNWLAGFIGAVAVVWCICLGHWLGYLTAKRRYLGELRRFEQAARRWLFLRRYLRVGESGAIKHLVFVDHDELAYVSETPAAAPVSALVDLAIDRQEIRSRMPQEDKQAK